MIPLAVICNAHENVIRKLSERGFGVVAIHPLEFAGNQIPNCFNHTDLQIFSNGKTIFAHPDIGVFSPEELSHNLDVIKCDRKISGSYPDDIAYNAAFTGKYLIHNTKFTAPEILEWSRKSGITLIDVKQGYARCTILSVDENSIITSDTGIAKKCSGHLDVLLIEPGYIHLEGYRHGFIGGCGGVYGDTVYLAGSLETHPDKNKILDFIESRGKKTDFLFEGICIDIGSIIFSDSYGNNK